MDLSDITLHSGRVQHLYTATTTDLGVVVWHSGGSLRQGHVLLYDRTAGDACRYELIMQKGAVLPLESLIRQRIENYGQKLPGCEYLSADYFR
jgi:hypothetical protein